MKVVSLHELAYELWERRRAYIKDTDPMDLRILVEWIQSTRAMLLEQKFKKPMAFIDDHYVQDLGSIEMMKELTNVSSVSNYDYMWRTSIEIPRTIESKEGTGTFIRIGPSDRMSDHFQVTTYKKVPMLGYGKFNKNAIYAFVLGDYVYLHSNGGLHFTVKYIDIRGVFQDPITAARIKDPDWTYDDDYPVNKEMIDTLKTLIVNDKFGLTLLQPHDKTDDKNDNPEGNVSIPKRQEQNQG